ncbi:conserved hypothetical protein [Frankia sp. Hr75.2]|nr:conserved hypothetical protein [Frankia sp. Hr75.2]
MRRLMVRYRVHPDRVAENEALVRAVCDELARTDPAGFRYATFRLDDGATFVHIASTAAADGSSPLPGLAAFQRFQEGIAQRCAEPPVVTELAEIGSFRFFDEPAS